MNKNRQRTKGMIRAEDAYNSWLRAVAGVERIEQHNFDRLVAQGLIVEGGASEKALPPKGAG